ncbi:hypothetical protein [Microbacterium sp.]|uniref:hypothetical protein n=1 Tax=Microbacterium sp. TaxID=51671 RepID=UPI003A8AA5F1
MRRTIVAVVSVAILAVAGCASAPRAADPDPTASASAPPEFATAPSGPIRSPGATVEVPTARWDALLADLADRGVTGPVDLVSAERVTWSDGSLGCPKPGLTYTQALVEGMQVVVRADDVVYDYRFGRGDTPVLCKR